MRNPELASQVRPDRAGAGNPEFLRDMTQALRHAPRGIPPKYFYDARGSALFDRICALPEYYPTRTELAILRAHAGDIAALAGPGAEIVEFGAGSLTKVRLLLDAFDAPRRFVPIDISGEHLALSAQRLRADYPALEVVPIAADYTQSFALPAGAGNGRRIGFFPGSTIGNFNPEEAFQFLEQAAGLLRGGALVVGADLVKAPALLHAAYNDSAGVTAEFNLNLLARANSELGSDFDLDGFGHCAFYNAPLQRIEMHLIARRDQRVVLDGEAFDFREGETLHTESSHKFTVESLRRIAMRAGFRPGAVWTDEARLFSVHWLQAPG